MKKIFKIAIPILIAGIAILIFTCNHIIENESKAYLYSQVSETPYNKVGLLLGTSPKLKSGRPNLYFNYRIEAAAALFHAGKIKYIVVSGDNRKNDYNEPEEMKQALVATGIPESRIILDYAGLRTLDSVIRAHCIFGLNSFTLISQKFHNERAVYLAHREGISAIGFHAKDVSTYAGLKTNARELLARVKVFVDILTHKAPRHMGEAVAIPE